MLRLISHLKVRGGAQDLAEALSSAVDLWLREQSQLPADCNPASVRGYQWKSLFLPEGSMRNAWKDLSIRRPQDKQFKMAHRLRLEQTQAAPAGPLLAGEGWDLPKRRKFRFRLEDVAFEKAKS